MSKEVWKEVYKGSGAHLERVLEMYHEMGHETRLEPMNQQEPEACALCFTDGETAYRLFVKEVQGPK